MRKEEKDKEPRGPKKPYRKPEIRSGKYPERRALACQKSGGGGGDCQSDFTS